MRQLLPPSVEHQAAIGRRLAMPVAHVTDTPRFAWRGAMLDVSRHFLPASEVKHFIDDMALYKLNRLHLHLSDDQGWRIEIKSWPNLTGISGKTAIGGTPAGFYTQEQYADIVNYARSRYVTIVPEIDMPGHMNAALVAYPDLKCDRVAPAPYLKAGGPPNSLCVDRDSTYTFVSDVVHEITAIAPTPYFSIGGDEVRNLSRDKYIGFIEHVQQIVDSTGARMIGWGEIAPAALNASTIVQYWNPDSSQLQVARGGKVIMSASPHMYIDMKFDSATVLGLHWAGFVTLQKVYDWDPATFKPGVGEDAVLGVEAPLWAETLVRPQDWEFMAFPRLTAVAEVGWTPQPRRTWDDFRRRVGAQGARMAALGINFARVPGVNWSW
jgi:hexosaminidase